MGGDEVVNFGAEENNRTGKRFVFYGWIFRRVFNSNFSSIYQILSLP